MKKLLKKIWYYILTNMYVYLSMGCFVSFILTADLIFSKYFFVEIILFLLGSIFAYLYIKNYSDEVIDEKQVQARQIHRIKNTNDWNTTYDLAVMLGKDEK